ncbi:MAG: dicarboxylate/amino acid:cation symporter [Chitinophagales bacterium]
MKKLALHWQIIIAMIAGVLFGLLASAFGLSQFTADWIKPIGSIFISLLKMIAMPLVLFSLIAGIGGLKDVSKLSSMGGKTIGLYITTTAVAALLGILLVNVMQPGKFISEDARNKLVAKYQDKAVEKEKMAKSSHTEAKQKGPLKFFEDLVPQNLFSAMTNNKNMLQIILFAFLFGIAMVMIEPQKSATLMSVIEGVNSVIIKMVDLIMLIAPIGVFALLASIITEIAGNDPMSAINVLGALAYYGVTVLIGLSIMAFLFYPFLLNTFTKYPYVAFFKAIRPAQLLAFSTSSSAATLPVTMECVEKNIGASKEVVGFVLPVGATVNMDGTSLYQAVAAVFIAQAFNMDLSMTAQLGIVLTATLASIGAAAVPSAGLLMLVIVLEQIGAPMAGIGLIFAMDRILDMCRTVVNVTGDATVATIIAHSEGQLVKPSQPV